MNTTAQPGAVPSSTESAVVSGVLPPPPVRFNGLFVRVDRGLASIDGFVSRWLPDEANPLARTGAAANLALLVAVASGILLLIWYTPSVQYAYSSLESIQGRTLGGWVRALHRYSSDLAMLLLLVHAGRTFFARKFAGARWLAWVTGVVMIGIVWFIGWTGYWLVWDQPAQQIAVSSMRFLDALPVFGEPLGRLYVTDRLVPSLLFFVVFFLHMLLPLGIAVGLAVHLARVTRARLLPCRQLTVALVLGMGLAAILFPAPLDEPARMAEIAEGFTVDAWYLTPLALGLRFQTAGLWVALFGTSAFSAMLPWLLGKRRPVETYRAVVDQPRCHSCNQCSQDCPFDAITMVPRTDGKPYASQASVDPLRCVGCGVCAGSCDSEGIGVPWFDSREEEKRMGGEIEAAIARGAHDWVAFICGDIDGGLSLFQREAWRDRLPGYQVYGVPNSSWVQPKFVERLLSHGVKGVLFVRDARTEAWSRHGGRWVAERLLQEREPRFRPQRAGDRGGAWRVVDFDPSRPGALAADAAEFQQSARSGVVTRHPRRAATFVGAIVMAIALGAATLAPSHLEVANPASGSPVFVLSFKVFGDWLESQGVDPEADADKPIHMRGRPTGKPVRAPIVIRVAIDGETNERAFSGKGLSHDGPAIGEWRILLDEGERDVAIEIQTGSESEPLRWSGVITAVPRTISVVTYDPAGGFRKE